MRQVFIALAATALMLAASYSGFAQTPIQFPNSGSVVFTAQLPPGWTSTENGNSLTINSSALLLALTFMVDNNPAAAQIPLDTLAPQILKQANATPPSGHEPITISGVNGTTYYSSMSLSGVQLDLNMALFQINGTYLAMLSVQTPNGINKDQKAALDQVLNSVGLKVTK